MSQLDDFNNTLEQLEMELEQEVTEISAFSKENFDENFTKDGLISRIEEQKSTYGAGDTISLGRHVISNIISQLDNRIETLRRYGKVDPSEVNSIATIYRKAIYFGVSSYLKLTPEQRIEVLRIILNKVEELTDNTISEINEHLDYMFKNMVSIRDDMISSRDNETIGVMIQTFVEKVVNFCMKYGLDSNDPKATQIIEPVLLSFREHPILKQYESDVSRGIYDRLRN